MRPQLKQKIDDEEKRLSAVKHLWNTGGKSFTLRF